MNLEFWTLEWGSGIWTFYKLPMWPVCVWPWLKISDLGFMKPGSYSRKQSYCLHLLWLLWGKNEIVHVKAPKTAKTLKEPIWGSSSLSWQSGKINNVFMNFEISESTVILRVGITNKPKLPKCRTESSMNVQKKILFL